MKAEAAARGMPRGPRFLLLDRLRDRTERKAGGEENFSPHTPLNLLWNLGRDFGCQRPFENAGTGLIPQPASDLRTVRNG